MNTKPLEALVERLLAPVGVFSVDGQHNTKGDPVRDSLRVEAAAAIINLRKELEICWDNYEARDIEAANFEQSAYDRGQELLGRRIVGDE